MIRLLLTLVLALGPSAVSAHDFWLDPSSWQLSPARGVTVTLRVGELFIGDAVPRNQAGIERFSIVTASGEQPVSGADGKSPAGLIPARRDETAVVLYRSRRSAVELEAEKFETYLREEGLDEVIAQRRKKGESGKRAREVFSRSAKTILGSPGSVTASVATKPYGLALEIVPVGDPRIRTRDGNSFRILFRGKPLRGALVVARNRKRPNAAVSMRTDDRGIVALSLDTPGEWLIKCVHMARIDEPIAEWESIWASLTFLRV